jgi:tRNA(Ile)-lysidine synthase
LSTDFFICGEILPFDESVMEKAAKNIALLDYDVLDESLVFRKWRKGDYFYPLGLGGKKKLSDFFIDRKFSLLQKEKQWIMCSGSDICWIVGHAIDDRYKIRDNTKVVLILEQQ